MAKSLVPSHSLLAQVCESHGIIPTDIWYAYDTKRAELLAERQVTLATAVVKSTEHIAARLQITPAEATEILRNFR